MKKYILVAGLVVASTSAMADRVVTGMNNSVSDSNRTLACADAKRDAKVNLYIYGEEVKRYYECSCSKGLSDDKGDHWICSVDATVGKK